MRRNHAMKAHWTNILFPWQVIWKDKNGDKIHWSNALTFGLLGLPPHDVLIKKQEGTIVPIQDDNVGNQQNQANINQITYILIALAIGLCIAFLFTKITK